MRHVRPLFAGALLLATISAPRAASAANATFDTGSIIVPMDTDYQDAGMLKAFGLLDALLRAGVPVSWCIKPQKAVTDATLGRFEPDFTATARDYKTSTQLASHDYRGGPFVIDASNAAAASTVISAWQTANPSTTVHVSTAPFTANVSRRLTASPRIAILNDGNQSIAFSYLNAAGITDDQGNAWSNTSSGLLTETAVAGTSALTADGALFRPSGQPAFCEIMTMHWNVTSTSIPDVTAEMASFLQFPVHVNAECQAVNAIEGEPPDGGRSNFVTTQGFVWPAPPKPTAVDFLNSDLPFAQMDGPFGIVGGSEPSYALASGSSYYDQIVMVKAAGAAVGVQDVWMTGYAQANAGAMCNIEQPGCISGGRALGKISYLGGHQYSINTPISTHPTTQGTRLFLNSLFEAGCVTDEGQPQVTLLKNAPAGTASPTVTYSITYSNAGPGPALDFSVADTLPTGTTFVSADRGGTFSGGGVTWTLGDLAKGAAGVVNVTVSLGAFGTFANSATGTYTVGLNTKNVTSNTASTVYAACVSDADCGTAASGKVCDSISQTCIDGCRGSGGNGCPVGTTCTSTDATPGQCVSTPDAGPDAGSVGDAGGGDAGANDGGSDEAGSSDAAAGDAASATDAGGDDGSTDATLGNDSSSASGGTSASSSGGTSSSGGSTSSGGSSGAASSGGTSSGSSGGILDGGDEAGTDALTAEPGAPSGCSCSEPGTSRGGAAGPAMGLLGLAAWRARRKRRNAA